MSQRRSVWSLSWEEHAADTSEELTYLPDQDFRLGDISRFLSGNDSEDHGNYRVESLVYPLTELPDSVTFEAYRLDEGQTSLGTFTLRKQ